MDIIERVFATKTFLAEADLLTIALCLLTLIQASRQTLQDFESIIALISRHPVITTCFLGATATLLFKVLA